MLTNFFGKSNPVNFIIVSLIFIIGFVTWEVFQIKEKLNLQYFSEKALMVILGLFMILMLDFIIRKNRLTETNTYSIFIFGCFLLMVPSIFAERNVVIANIFLLLAFRRIISIQSDKNLNKKILDASIWTSLAILFYFWSIWYFIPLLISIFLKSNKNYKHFLIPISGFATVFILVSTYYAFSENNFFWFTKLNTALSLNFLPYKNIHLLLIATIIILIVIWVIIRWLIRFSQTPKKNRPNYIILLIVLITGLGMALLSEEKNGSEFLFLFAPAAILFANYIEMINLKWLKELLLWTIVTTPFIIHFL